MIPVAFSVQVLQNHQPTISQLAVVSGAEGSVAGVAGVSPARPAFVNFR